MRSLSHNLTLLATLAIFPYTTIAQNSWLYPDPNTTPTYNNIDKLNASWATTFQSPSLLMWCSSDGEKSWSNKYNQSVPATGNRLIDLNLSDTVPYNCHFEVAAAKNAAQNNINSNDFNIQIESGNKPSVTYSATSTAAATSSKSSSAPTASSAASKASKTAAKSTESAAPKHTASSSGNNSGLSTGTTVGIVVGVVTGVFAATGALLLWLRSRKRWRRQQLNRYEGSMHKDISTSYQASEMTGSESVPVERDREVAGMQTYGHPVAGTRFVGELEGSETVGEAR